MALGNSVQRAEQLTSLCSADDLVSKKRWTTFLLGYVVSDWELWLEHVRVPCWAALKQGLWGGQWELGLGRLLQNKESGTKEA